MKKTSRVPAVLATLFTLAWILPPVVQYGFQQWKQSQQPTGFPVMTIMIVESELTIFGIPVPNSFLQGLYIGIGILLFVLSGVLWQRVVSSR